MTDTRKPVVTLVNKETGRLVDFFLPKFTANLFEGENVRDRDTLKLVSEDATEEEAHDFLHKLSGAS